MKRIPETHFSSDIMVYYIVFMPLYTFFFILALKPNGMDQLMQSPNIGRLAFFSSMLMAIQFVFVLISRIIMLLTRKKTKYSYQKLLVWDVCEGLVITMFWTLFLWLITHKHSPYFSMLPTLLLHYFAIMAFPYFVISLLADVLAKEERIEELNDMLEKYSSGKMGPDNNPVHFLDDRGNLKLLVTANNIMYIEAADNYVNIHYLSNNKIVRYSLRNTMKGIYDCCVQNKLVRCHRSYFVNMHRIRIIQKNPDGLFAILEYEGSPRIPISKNCADEVVKQFSALHD